MSDTRAALAGGALAALGYYLGGPTGASIGWSVGYTLFAEGPKVPTTNPGDLDFSASGYGKFLHFGFGTFPVTGVEIWSSDWKAKKHTEESGGKGGGGGTESEYYTYKRSMAVYLCDCTEGGEIVGIRSIEDKMTGEVLWSAADDADAATVIASQKIAKDIRIYTGSASQDPDPLIEAVEGWAPAHRGHAYMVIEDLKHGREKRPKVLKIVVVRAGTPQAPPVLVNDWSPNQTLRYVEFESGVLRDQYWTNLTGPYTRQTIRTWTLDGERKSTESYDHYNLSGVETMYPLPFLNSAEYAYCYQTGGGQRTAWYGPAGKLVTPVLTLFGTDPTGGGSVSQAVLGGDYIFAYGQPVSASHYHLSRWSGLVSQADRGFSISSVHLASIVHGITWSEDGYLYVIVYDDPYFYLMRFDKELNLLKEWEGIPYYVGAGYGYSFVVWNNLYLHQNSAQKYRLYQLNEDGSFDYLNEFDPVSATGMQPGYLKYGLAMASEGVLSLSPAVASAGAALSAIFTELAERSGRTAGDLDLSAVPAVNVNMAIRDPRAARDWMQELSRVHDLRMRTRANVVSWVAKGGAAVASIPDTDLGYEPGAGNTRPPVQAERLQPRDLPRRVTVIFPDIENDYNDGQQEYPMHNFPDGKDVTERLSVILSNQQARDLAVKWCKEPHLERMQWTTSLPLKWIGLEAGDPVDLSFGRVVVQELRETGENLLRLSCIADSVAAASGNGLPAALPTASPRGIVLPGPTVFKPLDIPLLRDLDDDAGFYAAGYGYLDGWGGATLFKSVDGGEAYAPVASFTTAANAGTAEAVFGDGEPGYWDLVNPLTVAVHSGAFTSHLEDDVYEGAGLCAIGATGRWELAAYRTATDNGDGTVTLSDWLRGLYGTEHHTGDHAVGDAVILLEATSLLRLVNNASELDLERLYKAVSLGDLLEEASEVAFTNTGEGKRPWSPVYLRGERDGSNNFTGYFNRRSRLSSQLWYTPVLGEESQSYEIDIYNAAFSTVVRTIAVSSETFSYSASEQSTDGLTPGDPINLKIYQLSATVGRGNPAEATL